MPEEFVCQRDQRVQRDVCDEHLPHSERQNKRGQASWLSRNWGGMIHDLKKRFQHSTEQSTKVSLRACAVCACLPGLPAERARARACAVCAARLPACLAPASQLLLLTARDPSTQWRFEQCSAYRGWPAARVPVLSARAYAARPPALPALLLAC